MTMYGFEPAAQHGWINLGCTTPGQNKSDPTGVITKAEGWTRYRIPSLFDLSPCVLPVDGSVCSPLTRLGAQVPDERPVSVRGQLLDHRPGHIQRHLRRDRLQHIQPVVAAAAAGGHPEPGPAALRRRQDVPRCLPWGRALR